MLLFWGVILWVEGLIYLYISNLFELYVLGYFRLEDRVVVVIFIVGVGVKFSFREFVFNY